jgi:hypothetical protein
VGGIAAGAVLGAGAAGAGEINAVVELFTSQGCSSCPAADALLGEYADRDDILALSFNVDYWDYLGWKDTLASPDNSERQRAYALARGDGQVYTPQVVIDGRTHVIGSSRREIESALAREAGALSVPIVLSATADAITVNIGEAATAEAPHATLWLVMYDRSVTVPIGRGENEGRTITYSNVVRKLRPIEMWKGAPMSVELPQSEMAKARVRRCAVLLQAEEAGGLPGPVLGAATLDVDE